LSTTDEKTRKQQALNAGFLFGAGERNRTADLRVTSALLYQLSYTGLGL
jgi:hypothetical protein